MKAFGGPASHGFDASPERLAGATSLEVVQTEVYRKEGSEWQLVHRNADPLVHRSTLQKAATLSRDERENE
jgi:hypothetical protein